VNEFFSYQTYNSKIHDTLKILENLQNQSMETDKLVEKVNVENSSDLSRPLV
jgi:hypothetical protein